MAITPKDYRKMAKKASPPSKSWKNIPMAFFIGGMICLLGQWLTGLYLSLGMEKDAASALTSISLVFLSILLTGLRLYNRIARFAGAGTLVPITGFANAMASPAIEFKTEGFILGVGAKMFTIAGPVIVYGVSASVLYGVIYWLMGGR